MDDTLSVHVDTAVVVSGDGAIRAAVATGIHHGCDESHM